MFHVKHWVQRDVEIIYLLIIHVAIPIHPARRLAAIRANSLRSDRALGGSN